MQAFLEWLGAIFEHYETIVAGLGLSLLIELIERVREKEVPKRWWMVFAIVGLVAAMFSAWKEERDKADTLATTNVKLQADLDDARKESEPDLKLKIDRLAIADVHFDDGIFPVAVLTANVTNIGSPSVAVNWYVTLHLKHGGSVTRIPTVMNMTMHGRLQNGQIWTASKDDALYDKTSNPIERGARIRGILMFRFDQTNTKEVRAGGNIFTLHCEDVNGKALEDSAEFSGNQISPLMGYPGLHEH